VTENIITDEATVEESEVAEIPENTDEGVLDSEFDDAPVDGDNGENTPNAPVDYEKLVREDVLALKEDFPELADLSDVTELDDPLRYAALRDLGLTPKEAYLATSKKSYHDTRSHLRRAHGRSATGPSSILSPAELAAVRDLFPGKSDADIQRLYKRVSG
jgi:hypothetical protein